jgi:DNA-binding transcriptional LysR family regulator
MQRSSTDIVDVLSFVRVAETGSFARAAERMGLSKPVLSRRVARLEEQLGARLLTRSARGAQPTEIGQAYYARAANILAELDAAEEVVAEAVTQIAGPVRLTAPLTFGVAHLAPALAEFALEYPRVELDVEFEDRTVDLAGGGYDMAIRIGRLQDSSLIARRIAPVRKHVIGSPAYFEAHGRPERPADLAQHRILLYAHAQWRFEVNGRWETVRTSPALRSNNGDMLLAAAEKGLGLALLPSFIAAPALERRTIERWGMVRAT